MTIKLGTLLLSAAVLNTLFVALLRACAVLVVPRVYGRFAICSCTSSLHEIIHQKYDRTPNVNVTLLSFSNLNETVLQCA